MSRLLGLALLPYASPAAAEPPKESTFQLRPSALTDPQDPVIFKRGFQFPRVDYVSPSGWTERKQGIVAGVELSPQTVVGIGFFDRKRRASLFSPDPQLDKPRRGKKVAVGVTVRF